jgi:hypothetical protein
MLSLAAVIAAGIAPSSTGTTGDRAKRAGATQAKRQLGGIGASGWSSFAARRSVRFSDDTPPLQPVVGVDIGARLRGMWG